MKLFRVLLLIGIIFNSNIQISNCQIPQKVDGNDIKAIISIIASDKFMGRESGTKGCEMTEEYFAAEFKKLNLKPAGDPSDYFYSYTIPFYKMEGEPSLQIGSRTFYYGRNEDFRIENNTEGGAMEGEVVFAGYGFYSPDNKRNDFEGLDLKGKIVLIRKGLPNSYLGKYKVEATDSAKINFCYQQGAIGVLFFEAANGTNQNSSNYGSSLSKKNPVNNFPVFRIDERVARYILVNNKTDLAEYNKLISNMETKYVSKPTRKIAKMSATIISDNQRKTRNVLAMIPGTDPKLKEEAIIIGGHMDHVGTNSDGSVNNGADDNASGAATVLGIAKALVKNKIKPKRTIIFACWTGEEKGLLGSEAWCEKPTFNLSNVVVYFNLDMVGLGNGNLDMPGTAFAPEIYKFITQNTDSLTLKKINFRKGGLGGSDHNPFLLKGIPAWAGMSSGEHPDYHQPADDADKIKPEILQFVGDFIYHCTEMIANSRENLISSETRKNNKFIVQNIFLSVPTQQKELKYFAWEKNLAGALIDITDTTSEKTEIRFLQTIKKLDELYQPSADAPMIFLQQSTDLMRISRSRKQAGLISINLAAYQYDELYSSALMKMGAKFGIINSGAPFLKDSIDKLNYIKKLQDIPSGIIFSKLPQNELINGLTQCSKGAMIIDNSANALTEKVVALMKQKNGLFVYEINDETNIQDAISTIEILNKLLGKNGFVISSSNYSIATYTLLRDIYIEVSNRLGSGILSSVFLTNFQTFAFKALSAQPVINLGGRTN